ncbi:hypothetical protein QR510_30410, partial [Escherichia coli]|uniref:hypothetical protein n=1 Tax=Escherichia coli TaxID=562 RepID=UPI002738E42C
DLFISRTVAKISLLIQRTLIELVDENTYQIFDLICKENYQSILATFDDIEDIYPASYLQMGMLLESELNSMGTYHDVFLY